MNATRPAHLTFLEFITIPKCLVKCTSYEAPHYVLLQPFANSSLLGPNILLSTLFSNTLSLWTTS